MTISYEQHTPIKNAIVIHVHGVADKDDDAKPFVSIHHHPPQVHVININNKTLFIETSPTVDGPWVLTESIKKMKAADIVIHNLYTRARTKANDTLNFWVTVFKQ